MWTSFVLVVPVMKNAVSRDVILCSLVEIHGRFTSIFCHDD
jgi:hypothetical protein